MKKADKNKEREMTSFISLAVIILKKLDKEGFDIQQVVDTVKEQMKEKNEQEKKVD